MFPERVPVFLSSSKIRFNTNIRHERPVRSLNDTQIKKLLIAAKAYPPTKMRILLALGTGLRRGDIDSLKVSDIDFEKNSITTTSRKTKMRTITNTRIGDNMANSFP